MTEIVLDEQGLELRRGGHDPVRLPWDVIGLLQPADGGQLQIHLLDGRILDVSSPSDAAAVFAAWRARSGTSGRQPRDAVPVELRRAAAQSIDLGAFAPASPDLPRIGGVYRAGRSSAVVDEQGVVIVRPRQGRLRIPWRAVRSVTAYELKGVRSMWVVRVRLHDRSNHLLPAPRTRRGERDPDFQRALREIAAALRASRPAPGEPSDQITKQMRRAAVREVGYEE